MVVLVSFVLGLVWLLNTIEFVIITQPIINTTFECLATTLKSNVIATSELSQY